MEDDYNHVSGELVYCLTNVPGPGLVGGIPADIGGCSCTTNCSFGCPHLAASPNYTPDGLLAKGAGTNLPIYECNGECTCEPSRCTNRVAQWGPLPCLQVIELGSKGWGLVTKRNLTQGQFICEYAGEVLGTEVARARAQRQTAAGKANYILVLREHSGGVEVSRTIVDPTVVGNIGRYLNHSCSPNLTMLPIRVDSTVPRLALFASRDILEGEELCFDYGSPEGRAEDGREVQKEVEDKNGPPRCACNCGAVNCRGLLPYDPELLSC